MRLVHRTAPLATLLLLCLCVPRGLAGDVSRAIVQRADPVYPVIARQMRVYGDVVLEASVEPDGHVSAAKVVSGHPMLTNAAQDAVRRWKFVPATQPALVTVRVTFVL